MKTIESQVREIVNNLFGKKDYSKAFSKIDKTKEIVMHSLNLESMRYNLEKEFGIKIEKNEQEKIFCYSFGAYNQNNPDYEANIKGIVNYISLKII
ncbi:MAG: hypothetical protein ACP5OG_00515 [Candidatus Nanoarchaeia archaeon]